MSLHSQTEKAYQKQDAIFIGKSRAVKAKKVRREIRNNELIVDFVVEGITALHHST